MALKPAGGKYEGVWLNEKLVIELKEIYTNHFKAFKEK